MEVKIPITNLKSCRMYYKSQTCTCGESVDIIIYLNINWYYSHIFVGYSTLKILYKRMFQFIILKLFQNDSGDLLMLPRDSQCYLMVIVSIKPIEYLLLLIRLCRKLTDTEFLI